LPTFTPIAAAIAGLLLAPAVYGADSVLIGARYSVTGIAPPSTTPPAFTLLDPAWLLPPIESLDLALPPDGAARAEQLLREDTIIGTPEEPNRPSTAKVGYSLSDDLTAQLRYHHSRLSDRANSQTLRGDQWSAFSTRPDRDVLDLNMSWHLAGNTVGLGYQFQSDRFSTPGTGAFSRFLPSSPQATHALTLGLTREWGAGAAPPVLIDPPLLVPELAVAAADATPTPSD